MNRMHRNNGMAGGSQFQQQSHRNQNRHDISDLTPDSHRELYLTQDQHEALSDLIDQSVSDRLNNDAECTEVNITFLSSVYEALSLIAKGQRTDIDGLLSGLIRDTLSQYIIRNK